MNAGRGRVPVVQAQRRLACTCNRLKWNEGARRDAHVPLKKLLSKPFSVTFYVPWLRVVCCSLLLRAYEYCCMVRGGAGQKVFKSTSHVTRHTSHVTRHMPHLQSLSSRIPNVLIFSASQLPWFRLAADDAAPGACTRVRGSGLHFQGFRVASLGVRKTHVRNIHTHTCWRRDNGL